MKYTSYLLLLVVILSSYSFLTCSEFGTGVHAQTLPMIYRIMDSNYLVNDWYVNQTDQFNMRFFYNHLIVGVNKLIGNLEWTFLLLHSLSFVLFHFFIFLLALTLFKKDYKKSLFATIIVFVGYPISLGFTSFFKGNLSPNGISWALIILAFYLYFNKKYFFSFLFLGLALWFNISDTLPIAGLLIGNLILSKPWFSKEKLINLFQSLPFFIISLILILPIYLLNITSSTLARLSTEIVVFTHIGHALPSTWTILNILPFLLLLLTFIFVFNKINLKKEYRQTVKNFIIIIMGYCLMGIIFVEFIPIAPISKMLIFRTTKVITLFAYIFISLYLFTRIKKSSSYVEKSFYLLFPISFIYPTLVILALPLFLLIESLKEKYKINPFNYLKNKMILATFIGFTSILILLLVKFLLSLIPPPRLSLQAALPYIILPVVIYLLATYFIWKSKLNFRVGAVIIILILTILIGPNNSYLHLPGSPTEQVDLFKEIKNNSSPDTVFLIQPRWVNFRLNTNRAVLIDGYYPFDDLSTVKWYLTLKNVSNNKITKTSDLNLKKENLVSQGYNSLTKNDLIRLKNKYKFDYVVFTKPKKLDLKVFYQNKKYVVYEI